MCGWVCVGVLECVHAGVELQSGVERKVGSVAFALTEGSWQSSLGEPCPAEGTWMAILLKYREPIKKCLGVHNIERGPSSG